MEQKCKAAEERSAQHAAEAEENKHRAEEERRRCASLQAELERRIQEVEEQARALEGQQQALEEQAGALEQLKTVETEEGGAIGEAVILAALSEAGMIEDPAAGGGSAVVQVSSSVQAGVVDAAPGREEPGNDEASEATPESKPEPVPE